jgi:hypothetical protein
MAAPRYRRHRTINAAGETAGRDDPDQGSTHTGANTRPLKHFYGK